MMTTLAFVLGAFATGNDPDLDLASALARRGWVDLADEICGRLQKLPGASVVIAEVASARARLEPDPARAVAELDAAIARMGDPAAADERGMAGYLRVQKAKLLNDPGAWEAVEAFYKGSLEALRGSEEALLDARLELAKAVAARARVTAGEAPRKKLFDEAVRQLLDFQLDTGTRPIAFEALLEEGRVRADLKDYGRAERCIRGVLALKRKGVALSEYLSSLHDLAFLELLRILAAAGKAKEAVVAADLFAREQPGRAASGFGFAVMMGKAEALAASGDRAAAAALAQGIVGLDPDGPAGHRARALIRDWTAGGRASAAQLLLIADGLMDRGLYRDALVELRRCVEGAADAAERAKIEPVTAFKRGECFRALRRDVEASLAFQDVFRKSPKHDLAQRAAFEAVRSLIRSAAGTRDPRDERQMELLLGEIQERELQGAFKDYFSFLEAEILERKGSWKAAADLYQKVGEGCEVYEDALVSAGHCLRRGVESKGDPKQLQIAESLLRRAASRLEKAGSPRLLVQARYELATVLLQGKPKEALEFIDRCARQLPPESEMLPRLGEMEIRARLALEDVPGAVARLDKLLSGDSGAAGARSARRVAMKLEEADPAAAGRYYRAWLESSGSRDASATEVQSVADGLYRLARKVSRFDEKTGSVVDLRGKPVPDPAIWKAAARAQSRVVDLGTLAAEERNAGEARRVCCEGLAAESAADWGRLKARCEELIAQHQLLGAAGLNARVLQKERWLAGVYLEYIHALVQLGKAGQKFQYANALTASRHLFEVAERGSEPWWVCQWIQLKILFERGEGADLQTAAAAVSLLERSYPGFDEGKYGMSPVLSELRDRIRASVGLRR